jgi:hypothetical protein
MSVTEESRLMVFEKRMIRGSRGGESKSKADKFKYLSQTGHVACMRDL